MSEVDEMLQVEGLPIMTRGQARDLTYSLPEGASFPRAVNSFLVGEEISREDLVAALPEARRASAESDRALELLLVIESRLTAA